MSIKAIHIILITCAILLSFGFGVWSMSYAKDMDEIGYQLAGAASFAIGLGLIFYGSHFIKKARAL